MTTPARDQWGATLVESILVIIIVSTVILTLATGLLSTVFNANQVNESERLSVAASGFAETIRDLPYVSSCASPGTADAYLGLYNGLDADRREATAGLEIEVRRVEYWRSNRGGTVTPAVTADQQWTAGCDEQGGAQKVTLAVSTPGTGRSDVTVSAQVVKRAPSRQGLTP